ncbi:MAG: desulfoferrodoxin [Candidatus Cloacimonas sp.]|nr:desulfoferrodoxin [Candidatus Cloacimonadota bacterium]
MTVLRELYYCEKCHNLVEIVQEGMPALVCCKQPMVLLEAQIADQTYEKHVPVVEKTDTGVLVKVGSTDHPMEEKHHIKFIEVLTDKMVYRAELNPGDKPMAEFPVCIEDVVEAREFCNIHGLWKK